MFWYSSFSDMDPSLVKRDSTYANSTSDKLFHKANNKTVEMRQMLRYVRK
jgi:hypothetical protein